MRTIDVFVSSFPDVQKEHGVAEQLIRSAAAEFNLSINVQYSNPRRGSRAQDGSIGHRDLAGQSALVLNACFWEHSEREENDFLEIPNTGLYDFVVCILGSRLGTTLAPQCVMPDGSRPRSATDYEVGWALYQSKQTPGCPGLHVYRSRAIRAAPLGPREQHANLVRPWDAVQAFCGAWAKEDGTGFRECCHDFQDLEEFEDRFRKHFREFLARRLNPAIPAGKTTRKISYSSFSPFRGLDFFDVQHATVYHGRTRAVGEVLDVLETQAAAKKPFLLVLGPSGSGKSSLVRAGVLPLITQGATPAGTGPWRWVLTRPGTSGDPCDTLADALLETSPEGSGEHASQLRKDPGVVTERIREVIIDQVAERQLDHPLANRKEEGLRTRENGSIQIAKPTSLAQVKPMTQLVLVVDQLEELFASFSSVIQQRYIAALCALANCQHVFIIATLRSDFYPHYQRFSGLTTLAGIYELQPPTPHGIRNIIQFRAQAAGLSFEQDPETNRSLDETILQAAAAEPEPLPLLEHLLARLYEKQLARKDGLLLWADYQALGGFQNALAQYPESVFLNLKSDEQEALPFVIRELLVPNQGAGASLNRRSIPYRDLVSRPQLNQRQRSGATGLIDRLIKEGLLSAKIDPQQELLISIPQEALLRRWPRLWELLAQDRRFLRMPEQHDANLKPRTAHGRQREDQPDEVDPAETQTLRTDLGSHLNISRIDYIKKSLPRRKPGREVPQKIGAAALAGLAIFGAFVGGERFMTGSQSSNKEHDIRPAQQSTDPQDRQRGQLDAERRDLQLETLRIARQNADRAKGQRSNVEADQRKAGDEKARLTQQTSNSVDNQRSAKKGSDSANEVRSGRALTLDSPQTAEEGISTQGLTAPVQSPNH
jgi:energy-coupling factor transporter ATP-binding protein EcfA2